MNLSIRLYQIADMVPSCNCLADVGTDHAHLPIYLVETGKCKKAIAMDVGKGPLEHAAVAVKMTGLTEKIELRLADGLAKLAPGEADTVTISGMGGLLITRILQDGKHVWDSVSDWVLSPQSEFSQFRHFLADNGFVIIEEKMVYDMEKYYVIVHVKRGRMYYEHEYEYAYGKLLIEENSQVFKDYLDQKQAQFEKVLKGMTASGTENMNERGLSRIAEIKAEIENIRSARAAAVKN